MDLGSTLIGVILIAICTIPLVSMYMKKKNKEHQMLNILTVLAQKENCIISKHEFYRNFGIGLDQYKNYAFFDKYKGQRNYTKVANLEEIQSASVVKTMRDGANISVISKIELVFLPKAKKKEVRFELFNDNDNMQLSEELQIAEKWLKIINEHI